MKNKRLKFFLKIIITLIILIAIFITVCYFVLTTNLWHKLPEGLRVQVALGKLELMSYDTRCHEECILDKLLYDIIISEYLIKEPEKMGSQIEGLLYRDSVLAQMKIYLVGIVKTAEEKKQQEDENYEIKIPDYLEKYLNSPEVDINVKKWILSDFGEQIGASPQVLKNILDIIRDENKSIDERIPAIWDLAKIASERNEDDSPKYPSIDYQEICDLLVGLAVDTGNNDQIRYAAIDNMYACTVFPDNYTRDIFDKVKAIFEDRNEPLGIRDGALNELKFYNDVSSSTVRDYMDKVYNDKVEHECLHLSVYGFFKRLGDKKYKKPDMTLEEATECVNEIGQVGYTRKNY